MILGLSGDTDMTVGFFIFNVAQISSRNFFVAVAVRAMMLTVGGKMLLTSPSREYSFLKSSPLNLENNNCQ